MISPTEAELEVVLFCQDEFSMLSSSCDCGNPASFIVTFGAPLGIWVRVIIVSPMLMGTSGKDIVGDVYDGLERHARQQGQCV